MAKETKPTNRELELYARKHGYRYVVLLGVNNDGETCRVTGYGIDRMNCRNAKRAADDLQRLIQDGLFVV